MVVCLVLEEADDVADKGDARLKQGRLARVDAWYSEIISDQETENGNDNGDAILCHLPESPGSMSCHGQKEARNIFTASRGSHRRFFPKTPTPQWICRCYVFQRQAEVKKR